MYTNEIQSKGIQSLSVVFLEKKLHQKAIGVRQEEAFQANDIKGKFSWACFNLPVISYIELRANKGEFAAVEYSYGNRSQFTW